MQTTFATVGNELEAGSEHMNIRMKTGLLVKITKLREADRPLVRAGNWNTYVLGAADNAGSLPIDYEMIGVLLERPVVGGRVRLLRVQRNGVEVLGMFESTQVVSIRGCEFATRNSVYRLENCERSSSDLTPCQKAPLPGTEMSTGTVAPHG